MFYYWCIIYLKLYIILFKNNNYTNNKIIFNYIFIILFSGNVAFKKRWKLTSRPSDMQVNANSTFNLFLIYAQEKEIRHTDQQKTNCARVVWQINSNAWTLVRVWTYDLWPLDHWPSQDLVMLLKLKPGLHSHRYEPTWLIQPWPSQELSGPAHSSISETEVSRSDTHTHTHIQLLKRQYRLTLSVGNSQT